ncbi:hypothetical protein L1887_15767 [Cichorium endivia]|nr:hypothetical protein L1887_15767 [Cichorium endivia]
MPAHGLLTRVVCGSVGQLFPYYSDAKAPPCKVDDMRKLAYLNESWASEELLWELFVQAGPVVNVYFRSEEDVDYAIKVLNMIKLYGKPIRVNKASQDKESLDVGANLFVGNLDPMKKVYDTFSAFGVIVTNSKITRDPETGNSRGFRFISYDSFEVSDASIECSMLIKKIQKESAMVPLQASSNPTTQKSRPHILFASGPPTLPQPAGAPVPFTNGAVPPVTTIPAIRPLPPPRSPNGKMCIKTAIDYYTQVIKGCLKFPSTM